MGQKRIEQIRYNFGANRKAYSNGVPVLLAEKELAEGWGYNVRNGEIVGIEKNPKIKKLTGTANSK